MILEMDNDNNQNQPEVSAPASAAQKLNVNFEYNTPKKKTNVVIFIILGLVVFLAIGGFLVFNRINKQSSAPAATPSSSPPLPTPLPSPSPVLNRAEWSLEVLNGSGTSGLAKKIADSLKELGYEVVKTGNADKSNYSETQILVREGLEDKVDLVIADLKDVIKIASVAGELTEGTASARIIIGKDF